ncbi:MAG: hypothetical protein ACYC0C_15930 [Devosia sp.]
MPSTAIGEIEYDPRTRRRRVTFVTTGRQCLPTGPSSPDLIRGPNGSIG